MTKTTISPSGPGQPASALDPEVRRFATAIQEAYAGQPMDADTPMSRAREIAEIVRRPWAGGGPRMVATEDRCLPLAAGRKRVRVLTPAGAEDGPALVYLHGGGWTLFSLETHDRLMREYASRARIRVIGVDYSLSPEARFPRPVDEVCAVIRWLGQNGEALGVNAGRLAIGGDSAGANLSVAACLKLRDAGATLPLGMVLNYGAYDASSAGSAAAADTPADFTLTHDEMRAFWLNYLRGPDDISNPLASVIRADLDGLPPALMVIADWDVLYAENLEMAARLRAAGVPVRTAIYPGTTHSFLEAVSVARVAGRALDESAAWLRATLA